MASWMQHSSRDAEVWRRADRAMGRGRARGQGMDGDVKVRMDGDGQQRRKALKLDCPALIIRTEPPSVWSLCTLLIEHHFRSPRGFG